MTKLAEELKQTNRCDKLTQNAMNGVDEQSSMSEQNMISYKSGMILKDWHRMKSIEMATKRIPNLCSWRCFSKARN